MSKKNSSLLLLTILFVIIVFLFGQDVWFGVLTEQHQVKNAFVGGLVAALATGIGTLPIMFSRQLSDRITDSMLGFGAGVMLAASVFSLILPGMEILKASSSSSWSAASIMGLSILLGAALLMSMEYLLPHEHFISQTHSEQQSLLLKRTWLFVFAICLHNFPEGLAIGVGFAGVGNLAGGTLATGIAIQDIPEGLVVAVALLNAGYRKRDCMLIGIASGLIEPVGAVLGAAVITVFSSLLPWGLGVAAGAMLFVISHEIIPESHRKGHETFATGGLMIGFVVMMVLDTALA